MTEANFGVGMFGRRDQLFASASAQGGKLRFGRVAFSEGVASQSSHEARNAKLVRLGGGQWK